MKMEKPQLLLFLLVLLLSSCALKNDDLLNKGGIPNNKITAPSILDLQSQELKEVSPPKKKPTIAIYPSSFTDQTGQRRSNSEFALFSTAITQAPHAYLLRALKHSANGQFWRVIERIGLDNLVKERTLIRSTREGFKQKELSPLLFAGLLIEGAVVDYDVNQRSGGVGFRYLGISSSNQYREDTVTISLRLISVLTGEVLIEVMTTKTILSVGISQDVFRFIELGTELIELEGGFTENESGSIALQKAIEKSVLEIINIGYERGYWEHEEIIIEPSCDDECIAAIRG
jgi:curli production assembly/transport component CsgG